MAFKTMDDIEDRKKKESREKMKVEISEDINDVIGNVFSRPKIKRRKTFGDWIFTILKTLGFLSLLVIVLDIVLGSIWLLQFFIKSLFFSS